MGLGACNEFSLQGQDSGTPDAVDFEEHFTQAPEPRVDLLWVIDDTGSMAEEHAALADAFGTFAAALSTAGLAWQMGVTTTDVTRADAGQLRGDPWILTPALPDTVSAMREAASVGTDGSEPSSGLGAAWLALSDPLATSENRGFRRAEAGLHVVVVSDGDDAGDEILGFDTATAMAALLDDAAATSGQPARLSALVGDPGAGCSGEGGTALPGTRYLDLANATGGAVGSICAADLSAVTEEVVDQASALPTRFPLQASPSVGSARVEIDGVRVDGGWGLTEDPPALEFSEPPPAGAEIGVRYQVDAT